MLIDIYIITLLFIAGLFFGMLFTIVGLKFPIKDACYRNVCNNCNEKFKIRELIPVFSYFVSGGKCDHCKKNITLLVPLIELFSAFLFPMSYIRYGFSYEMIAMLIISSILLIIFVSDFLYYIINDSPLMVASILILLFKFIFFGFRTFLISVVSGVALFLFLYLIKIVGDKIFKAESLGGGDIKLVSFFGFTLGIRLGIVSIILGALLSFPYALFSSFNKDEKEIPFGPFLISGLMITFVFMDKVISFLNIIFK